MARLSSRHIKNSDSQRDLPLEALRGIAALIVVAWHFLFTFYPFMIDSRYCTLCGTPLFAFFHGTAAVSIFFTLSGYVLTRRYFETGAKRILIIGALKRPFRLFLPVFLSVMLSWLLFHFDLYAYGAAGAITHSGWLLSFGYSMDTPFVPDFGRALKEGLTAVFTHDKQSFNPILWTIPVELVGSYIVFAFAALAARLRGQRGLMLLCAALVTGAVSFIEPNYVPFLPGCLLAFYAPRIKSIKLPAALVLIALALVMLGYREPAGFYTPFDILGKLVPVSNDAMLVYTSTVGAVLLMISFIGCAPLRQALSGTMARILGRLSFPLYLVHMLLLCSLASAVFAAVQPGAGTNVAVIVAMLVFLPALLAVATVFAVIDVKWVAFVNRMSRKIKI